MSQYLNQKADVLLHMYNLQIMGNRSITQHELLDKFWPGSSFEPQLLYELKRDDLIISMVIEGTKGEELNLEPDIYFMLTERGKQHAAELLKIINNPRFSINR